MKGSIAIEHFELQIKHDGYKFEIRPEAVNPTPVAFNKKYRKIYVLRNGNKFLYVGEANTDIKTRIGRGFTSFRYYNKTKKARGGYKGYKWIAEKFKRHSRLTVITFMHDLSEQRPFIEAIEGELVLLIRTESGKWPEYQNEIHFSNQKGAASLANKIFAQIGASN